MEAQNIIEKSEGSKGVVASNGAITSRRKKTGDAEEEEESIVKCDSTDELTLQKLDSKHAENPPLEIVWRNVVLFALLHLASLYALLFQVKESKWQTLLWTYLLYLMGGLGVTAGSHRLWSHRSFKAAFPLRLLLVLFQTSALQNDVIEWARDHRVHHKYSETHADPHNANRGFFFAHIGWLLCRKHPEVKEKGKQIDLSDLYRDPLLVYQRKYYKPLVLLFCFLIPTIVPWCLWDESLLNAYFVPCLLRLTVGLNLTWAVNSVAHLWGTRPYDAETNPAENILVILGAAGEGHHNYHHTFPHDYSTSEHNVPGLSLIFNITTVFIDAMASIGWAYGRKRIDPAMVDRKAERSGDGHTHLGVFNPFAWRCRA